MRSDFLWIKRARISYFNPTAYLCVLNNETMPKIKAITTTLKTDQTPEEGVMKAYELRDENENIILLENYDEGGNIEMKIERTYDDKNRVLVEKQYSVEKDPDEVHSFEYFESGKLKSRTILYRDNSKTFQNYSYDEAANTEKVEIVDDEGEAEGSEYRRYSSEGKILEEEIHGDFGLEVKTESEFDDFGNVLKRTTEDGEGYIVDHFYKYERDEESRIQNLKVIDDEGQLVKVIVYLYDEKNRIYEQQIKDTDRGWAFKVIWEYDDKDRVIKEERADFGGKVQEVQKIVYGENDLVTQQEKTTSHGMELSTFQYDFF